MWFLYCVALLAGKESEGESEKEEKKSYTKG